MHHLTKKTLVTLVLVGLAGAAQADIVSGLSHADAGAIRLGASTVPPAGQSGVTLDGQFDGRYVPAAHFARQRYLDSNQVYRFSGRQLAEAMASRPGAPDHSKVGVWSFAQVGSQDVWFGEWSAESTSGDIGSKSPGTHTVWYVGENGDVASTLPTGAPVSYTVRSINNYTGAALPTSTLTANFATGAASSIGDIGFSGGAIKTAGRNVQLAASDVKVASSGGVGGKLEGDFFGTGAAGVAGIVKFADRNRDTAFGGSKNP